MNFGVGEIHVTSCGLVVKTQDPVKASNLRTTVGELMSVGCVCCVLHMRYHEEDTALQVFILV